MFHLRLYFSRWKCWKYMYCEHLLYTLCAHKFSFANLITWCYTFSTRKDVQLLIKKNQKICVLDDSWPHHIQSVSELLGENGDILTALLNGNTTRQKPRKEMLFVWLFVCFKQSLWKMYQLSNNTRKTNRRGKIKIFWC